MIEINTKAKLADPWDTTPLTMETFWTAREEGKYIWIFRKSEDTGVFIEYDAIPAARVKPTNEWLQMKFFDHPERYQLRAHAEWRAAVVQMYYRPQGGPIFPELSVPCFSTGATREKVDARREQLRLHDPTLVFEEPRGVVIKMQQGKRVLYNA